MMTGCTKKEETITLTLERVGDIDYASVNDIVDSYTQAYINSSDTRTNIYFDNDPEGIQRFLNDDGNSTMRIGFFYKFKPIEEYDDPEIDLCENGTRKVIPNTNLIGIRQVKQNAIYKHYFPLELLKKEKIISQKKENQKDICFYVRPRTRVDMSTITYYKSNTLTYTAEEISLFLDTHNLR